jgi:hypothetical protein
MGLSRCRVGAMIFDHEGGICIFLEGFVDMLHETVMIRDVFAGGSIESLKTPCFSSSTMMKTSP